MKTRVEEVFHAVADFSEDARRRYFAEKQIEESIRREVEALLEFDAPATATLELEIGTAAQRALERLDPKNARVGVYRIGDLLGRGGMGSVYSAERVDGEISQRVAVKLLRPGLDDPRIRQRFFAERNILAALSHPNIARLFDAGHREDGQPFLVMEYVAGQPIDVYTADFSIRQKIRLFLKVCGAVAYLHRNLVVHRDLKPQNILVTRDGEPKLLDFGIAKILDFAVDSTVTGLRMLTPDYASPEQVTGGAVTTATDIYSLGAVLYKLLTGEPPHHFQNDSVEAIATAILGGNITPPSKLAPGIKRDLESILMKALRREPHERYHSIEQFAEDLESFLEFRPVRARKGGAWYRTRRFVRRYWIPVGASALAIAGLATGLAVANRERNIAQRRFQEVRALANKLFDIDQEARKVPGNTKTRQMIVDTSLEYLRRLSVDAHKDPELALELGNAYTRVARVQGVPVAANLGQMEEADQNLQIAERLIGTALAADPRNRMAMVRLAIVEHDRMLLARLNRRNDDALAFAVKSADWLEKYHAGAADKPEASRILNTYMNVADQFMLSGKYDDALRLTNRGLELSQTLDAKSYRGSLLWVSADVLRRQGDIDGALKQIRESIRILTPESPDAEQGRFMNYVYALIHEAWLLGDDAISQGNKEAAAPILLRAFEIADGFVHRDPNDQNSRGRISVAGISAGEVLRDSDPKRALEIYDHLLRHASEIGNNPSFRRFEVAALAGSSYPLRKLGKNGEAKRRLDAAFSKLEALKMYPSDQIKPESEPDRALCALADFEAGSEHYAKAASIYQELIQKMTAWGADPRAELSHAADFSRVYAGLESAHRRGGNTEGADEALAKRRELWRYWNSRIPSNSFIQRQMAMIQ